MSETNVILFDGYCFLCTGLIRFILDKDIRMKYELASQQSALGQYLLGECREKEGLTEHIVLISNEGCCVKSDAVLTILRNLPGIWAGVGILRKVPRFTRDWIYDVVASNRYRWFGRREVCISLIAGYEDRFMK